MNERAVMMIMSILGTYPEPQSDWSKHQAEEITFSRCAIEEILNQIWDHPRTLASETIERFADKMELYEAFAATQSQKRIFAIAFETAQELFETIKEVEN